MRFESLALDVAGYCGIDFQLLPRKPSHFLLALCFHCSPSPPLQPNRLLEKQDPGLSGGWGHYWNHSSRQLRF